MGGMGVYVYILEDEILSYELSLTKIGWGRCEYTVFIKHSFERMPLETWLFRKKMKRSMLCV